jgi:hypothetical protein
MMKIMIRQMIIETRITGSLNDVISAFFPQPFGRRQHGVELALYSRTAIESGHKKTPDMAMTVKKIVLWRKEVENRSGILANALAPLANAGTDIHVVMGYREPGQESKAAIEFYPVTGRKSVTAAKEAGFSASAIAALLVEGDNRAGLGYATAQAIADAGINMDFVVAQVVGRKYSAVFGFESDADATKCAAIIRKAAAAKKTR